MSPRKNRLPGYSDLANRGMYQIFRISNSGEIASSTLVLASCSEKMELPNGDLIGIAAPVSGYQGLQNRARELYCIIRKSVWMKA